MRPAVPLPTQARVEAAAAPHDVLQRVDTARIQLGELVHLVRVRVRVQVGVRVGVRVSVRDRDRDRNRG